MPDGKNRTFKDYDELEKTYNDLKNERTQLSAELGDLIKPVNEKRKLMDSYVNRSHGEPHRFADDELAKRSGSLDTKNSPDQCHRTQCGYREGRQLEYRSTAASPATWAFASR